MTFEPEKVIKRTKGKMIMLYVVVDGEESHMASFFHADKAQFTLNAIAAYTDADIVDEDKPKKGTKAKKVPAKKSIAKKKIIKKKGLRR